MCRANLDIHGVEPVVTRSVREQFDADWFTGPFVLDEHQPVIQFGSNLILPRLLPEHRQEFALGLVEYFHLGHSRAPSLIASVR